MSQQIIAHAIAIPRIGQMLKIKDLHEESNLKSNIDLIAVIAKIGEKKMSTQSQTRGPLPAREIYLCDDSWTMIKLIARDFFAENNDTFKSDQIIYIRNVKPMKLRGYTVLATMPDTLLNHEANTPEAVSLRCWLSENNLEFKHDGLKDLLFKRFTNLSCLNNKNSPTGPVENINKESQLSLSSSSSNSVSESQTNDTEENKKAINLNVLQNKRCRKHSEEVLNEGDLNIKMIKIDLTPKANCAKTNGIEVDSSTLSDSATQKVYSDIVEKTTSKGTETIISIDSGDEDTEMKDIKKTFKRELLEREESDVEVVDDDKDNIISETFSALMRQSPMKKWNMEKDKYLINFLCKHDTKQLTHDMFLKLYQANLNIFRGLSIEALKSRAEVLASPKKYIYLLQLCGGKEVKTEKEKCIFIERVERLRKLMRSHEIKEENNI